MRLFALSDIHVDYPENMLWIKQLSNTDYQEDSLLLAGDATHDMGKLEECFNILQAKFRTLFFVPGNHELWVMKGERGDSLDKFHRILDHCASRDVLTKPTRLTEGDQAAWVVPLFSWYVMPEQGSCSLFIPKQGGDSGIKVWSDSYFVKWPTFAQGTAADYFLTLNQPYLGSYDAPVISFSHFLSRQDLMFQYGTKMDDVFARAAQFPTNPAEAGEGFNFSRVAGTRALEAQVRALGSRVHIHGHQHRNRFRVEAGILYVSHCLGYKHERIKGILPQVEAGPLQVWDTSPAWQPQVLVAY